MDGGNWCILSTYLGMVCLGYVCFWGVSFCLFWTMGNPGKFMVCFLFVIFLHAYFVVPYFVVLRYCGIGGSIVGDFVSMVIMIMIMMIAISRSRDLGCHDVTMMVMMMVVILWCRDLEYLPCNASSVDTV